MPPQVIILVILVFLSAIFSGSETALVSLTKSKVDELVAQKKSNSRILRKLKQNPHRLLITILIGNNIVNIGSSAYAAVIFTDIFGSSGVGIATGLMTFFILVFGEITPKSFAHQHAVGVSLYMARPIYYLQIFLHPLVWGFEKIVNFANRISGTKKTFTVTEGELVAMLKIGAQEGSIDHQEREFIENVLEFNDIEVKDVMTPRVAINAIDQNMTINEAVQFAINNSHSRIPIYKGSIDNIIGIISIKDLLIYSNKYNRNKKISSLKAPLPLEVPLTKKIDKLFREFQRKHVHIAIVIDRFGGTAGLVTLEDLLEEIVGDIVDEFDPLEKPIDFVNKNTIIVSGSVLIEDINDALRITFAENELQSINTFVIEKIHRFPREGEIIEFPRAKVEVLQVKKNGIAKAKIIKKKRKITTD